MADNDLIAAILASGMLAPLPPPAIDAEGRLDATEQERLARRIGHAVGLYRGVLEALRIRAEASERSQTAAILPQAPLTASSGFLRQVLVKGIAPLCLAAFLAAPPAGAADCVNADPQLELGGVQGDFELTVDPQDPAQNLISVANANDGAANVVAARISGLTGKVLFGSLTTIANNFFGKSILNGPEFVRKPSGELGVVYAGHGGVHAVFRPAAPANWHQFKFDVAGAKILGSSPPVLANTSDGAFPAAQPLAQHTYGQAGGDCIGLCYGRLEGGRQTDVRALLAARGLTVKAATQSPRDGHIFFAACDAIGSCGVYEGTIDGEGGFTGGAFNKVAATGRSAPMALAATTHPVTGSTIVFANRSNIAIDVWTQPEPGGSLTFLDSAPASSDRHYRVATGGGMTVLTYLIRDGSEAGTYTLPILAAGNTLRRGDLKRVSTFSSGAELSWLPAANKWAIFYRSGAAGLTRCWVTP